MHGEEWLWVRTPPCSRERGRRLRRGSVLRLASIWPKRLGERPGAVVSVLRTEMQAFVSFPLILSPAQAAGGGRGGGQGWPRGADRLRGVRWSRDGVLSRSTPDCAAEPSSQPWTRRRARAEILSGCIIIVITVVRLGPFKVFLSLYLCTEGKGAKMEKGFAGRDKAPPPLPLPCSPPPQGPRIHRGGPASPTVCLLFAVTVPGPSPGVSQRGDPLAGVSKRVTFLLMGVPALLFTGWPVSQSYLHFLTC